MSELKVGQIRKWKTKQDEADYFVIDFVGRQNVLYTYKNSPCTEYSCGILEIENHTEEVKLEPKLIKLVAWVNNFDHGDIVVSTSNDAELLSQDRTIKQIKVIDGELFIVE